MPVTVEPSVGQGPAPEPFPWRDGNHFELLVDGAEFFPRMIDAVNGAVNWVCMEMYLVESGEVARQFVDAFVDASRRGVCVQLLLDDFGGLRLSRGDRKALTDAGVQLVLYNPLRIRKLTRNLYRTHRKLMVVDDTVAFVGGMGVMDGFHGEGAWRETMVEIRGPVLADWRALFEQTWTRWAPQWPVPGTSGAWEPVGTMRGRVASTHREAHTEIKRAFLARVARSNRRVWLATAYFVPSRKIRRALRRAARRGVDVRVILPGPITDHPAVRHASRRFYARLLRFGVRIFEYQDRFMHAKVMLLDDWVSVGSSNLDRWGLRWNLEANQEVDSVEFVAAVEQMLYRDLADSNEIEAQRWGRRSRVARAKERMWGTVDLWLARWRPR